MQALEGPAVVYKVCGQPVKKQRMSWFFALGSKIIRIPCNSFPEMMLPDPVDNRSRRKRIFWINNPTGKLNSSASKIIINPVRVVYIFPVHGHPTTTQDSRAHRLSRRLQRTS